MDKHSGAGMRYLADLWSCELRPAAEGEASPRVHWCEVQYDGVAPSPRAAHTATRVRVQGCDGCSVWVVGGWDGRRALSDVYRLVVPSWAATHKGGPYKCNTHNLLTKLIKTKSIFRV